MSKQEDTNKIETYLDNTMRSVRPPDDVMKRLRDQIGSLEPNIIAKRLTNWEFSLIIVGSVIAVATVILTIARAFYYFFNRSKRSA